MDTSTTTNTVTNTNTNANASSKEATIKESAASAQRLSERNVANADENSNSTDSEGREAATLKRAVVPANTTNAPTSSPPTTKHDVGNGSGGGGGNGVDNAPKASAQKMKADGDGGGERADVDGDDGDDDDDGESSQSDDGKQAAVRHTPPMIAATSEKVTTSKQQKPCRTATNDGAIATVSVTATATTNVRSDKKAHNSGSNSPLATGVVDADTLVNTDSQSSVEKSPPPPTQPPVSATTQPANVQTTATKVEQTSPTTTTTTSTTIASTTIATTTATQKPTTVTADIPDTILSPPKSETQTDETNTATSSSPASEAQLSPVGTNTAPATPTDEMPTKRGDIATTMPAAVAHTASKVSRSGGGGRGATGGGGRNATSGGGRNATSGGGRSATSGGGGGGRGATSGGGAGTGTRVVQPINVVANGTIPKSGKPLMSAMNKKLSKSSRPARPRKQKALVAMYESEISDNKIGIKLCIKKSDTTSGGGGAGTTVTLPANATSTSSATTAAPAAAAATTTTTPSKQNRKRSRKSKARPRVDSDDSEYETKRKKERAPNNNADKQKKVSFSGIATDAVREPVVQTEWGAKLPEDILYNVFKIVIDREGCLPTLFRLGRVCSLWREVSLRPALWRTLDLTTWIKDKYRNESRLKWFIDNRCSACTDLNVSNWKVSDINCFLHKLAVGCPNLTGITLSGWKGFTSDHLTFLVENMKKLGRLDLSSINVEMNASKSAVGLQSLCNAVQTMNGRLTHLYLAHNRLAGIPQIVTILSKYCPNLVLLDLSNVTTQATSHGILHIEKLQHGCGKLKVLRVTNSHVTLGTATMQEMMDSPGFPDLEELSVAALTDESRVIGDEHLQRMLKSSSKLKLLDVRGCTRLTHESLIRLPAWDIKHLFLSGCSVTRDVGSGLELIASKWAHSLIELDLAWANVQQPLDNALRALAEKGSESPLAHLNLCGSSVSDDAVKEILANCAHMSSINLSSCRGLPRGVKRLMQGPQELHELREVLKVQMKVKLPAQLKQEQEEKEAAKRESSGSGGGVVSQTN